MQNRSGNVLHLTINQKPNGDDFAKAREVIEIRGTGDLTLQDRRVMNMLYANAGQKICEDVQHVISIAELRGSHKGGERVRDSIIRLMTTVVQVPVQGRNGKPATKRVQVLSDTTTSDDENDPTGQVVYSFSRGMREIIKDSTLWGRVRTAVIFAFTSKYSLTLYELISARINLDFMWQEDFALRDFRALMGVPDDKLHRMPDLLRFCVKVAQDEVNGMAGRLQGRHQTCSQRRKGSRHCHGFSCFLVAEERRRAEGSLPGDQSLEGWPTCPAAGNYREASAGYPPCLAPGGCRVVISRVRHKPGSGRAHH
jgi:hypothetical protein